MGRHHRVEPVLQRRRLVARPTGPVNQFRCQRCDRRFEVQGICQDCPACVTAAAAAGVFGPCPGGSGS